MTLTSCRCSPGRTRRTDLARSGGDQQRRFAGALQLSRAAARGSGDGPFGRLLGRARAHRSAHPHTEATPWRRVEHPDPGVDGGDRWVFGFQGRGLVDDPDAAEGACGARHLGVRCPSGCGRCRHDSFVRDGQAPGRLWPRPSSMRSSPARSIALRTPWPPRRVPGGSRTHATSRRCSCAGDVGHGTRRGERDVWVAPARPGSTPCGPWPRGTYAHRPVQAALRPCVGRPAHRSCRSAFFAHRPRGASSSGHDTTRASSKQRPASMALRRHGPGRDRSGRRWVR